MRRPSFWLISLAVGAAACTGSDSAAISSTTAPQETSTVVATTTTTQPPRLVGELSYEIVAVYPHNTSSFTQGLEFTDDGRLLEGTGLFGESRRAIVDLETGDVVASESIEDELFGEGLTEVGNEVFQLTWLSGTAVVSNSDSLAELRRYSYEGQGWGLCFDGAELVMSDGSTTLTYRDPSDFSVIKRTEVVSDRRELLGQLNELECVGDQIWANLYQTNQIVAIDSNSGQVAAWLDLSALEPEVLTDPANDVLNGIAYRAESDTFFVTGKRWAQMYELRLVES